MRATPLFAGIALVALSGALGQAQVQRWNDRGGSRTADDAPRINLFVDGYRGFYYGEPVPVHFQVSDDAYVLVGRVDSNGRLTILFPRSRLASSFAPGNALVRVRGSRAGAFGAFYATDVGRTGFVFAVASYAPFDLSAFRSQDFERIGLPSQLSEVNRRYAYNPSEYVERFASWVLFDGNTPYDYDIDYYSVDFAPLIAGAGAFSQCYSNSGVWFDDGDRYLLGSGLSGFGFHPYGYGCGGFHYGNFSCFGFSRYSLYGPCLDIRGPFVVRGPIGGNPPRSLPPITGGPGDVNTKVLTAGLWRPDTVGRIGDDDSRLKPPEPVRDAGGRRAAQGADSTWSRIFVLPRGTSEPTPRATDPARPSNSDATGATRPGWTNDPARNGRTTPSRDGMTPPRASSPPRSADAPARHVPTPAPTHVESRPAGEKQRSYTPRPPERVAAPPVREPPRAAPESPRQQSATPRPPRETAPAIHREPPAPARQATREQPRSSPPPRQATREPPPSHPVMREPPPSRPAVREAPAPRAVREAPPSRPPSAPRATGYSSSSPKKPPRN
jgi:hypothetical protein